MMELTDAIVVMNPSCFYSRVLFAIVFTGFLVQYLQGKPMEECIKCAHYTAKLILQVSGVTLIGKPDY